MNNDPEPAVGWAEALGAAVDNPPNPTANGWTLYHKDEKTGAEERYVVPVLQNRHKGQFELWVRGEALRAISEVSSESMRDDMMSVYQSDFINGHYKWDDNFDGKKIRSARGSLKGALHLLYLLMRSAHPDLTEDKAFEIYTANSRETVSDPAGNKVSPLLAAYRYAMGNWQAPATAGAKQEEVKLTAEEMAEAMRRRAQKAPPATMNSPASA